MDAVERDVYFYLVHRKAEFVPMNEISRRVGGRRRFHHDPTWVLPVLSRMTERGILERDGAGCCRLRQVPKAFMIGKLWAAPRIAEALQYKSRLADKILTVDYAFDYYDRL